MKKEGYKYHPRGWQLDPDRIDTDRVQYWKHGTMLTVLEKKDAVGMVKRGDAFVITGQAIGAMKDGISIS